ncbi:hypothetical protein RIF29_41191 [Crotalaria pallida]|uniref:Uncharacterized protein n=1 Tax=Crotalaria pallida TaxID=3830 RepID=A0AAN9E6V3_CROPI
MDAIHKCGNYIGRGYVCNWGNEENDGGMHQRHQGRLNESRSSPTAAHGNRKFSKSGLLPEMSEIKRKKRMAKYKSYELKSSLKKGLDWLKTKCGKKNHMS